MQGETFESESVGEYLWAPGPDAPRQASHWASLDRVAPGDVIFSYVNQSIVAIVVPTARVHLAPIPQGHNADGWTGVGRRIEAKYNILDRPLPRAAFPADLPPMLAVRYGPFNVALRGNTGYLFEVQPEAGRRILQMLDLSNGDLRVDDDVVSSAPTETERAAIGLARVGQGVFRESLVQLWAGRCAVSGVTNPALLRASHIKSWRDSNNFERLDRYNGLLLAANYDAVFDRGLIAFDDYGAIRFAPTLSSDDATKLGISTTASITLVKEKHLPYLYFHRRTHGFT